MSSAAIVMGVNSANRVVTRMVAVVALALVCSLLPIGTRADLDAYLRRPESAYRWSKVSEKTVAGVKIYDLHLISQTWQGIVWEHRLELFVPEGAKYPHFCAMLNTGGNGGASEDLLGAACAKSIGSPFAVLYNIPNQPLYGGLSEDALIVYTWQKFLTTGDESWPLHFPMAKAVLKAMDALQEFTRTTATPITEFVVTGASKRGWTTWLAGASRDRRIKGIAPMVIDTLNLPAQSKHQLEAYGAFSEQIGDYTRVNIMEQLETPAGKRLLELEDPYSYRERLSLPKLLILGTNDRYWSQDALNIYWDDLKSPKWVLYTPNSGHGLEDRTRVLNTLTAFCRSIASRSKWPKMIWKFRNTADGGALTVVSDPAPVSARLFRAEAKTQDFRESRWTSVEAAGNTGVLPNSVQMPFRRPSTGYAATFAELTYEIDGKTFTLSTQLQIVPAAKPTR